MIGKLQDSMKGVEIKTFRPRVLPKETASGLVLAATIAVWLGVLALGLIGIGVATGALVIPK